MEPNGPGCAEEPESTTVPVRYCRREMQGDLQADPPYAIEYADGTFDLYGHETPSFKIQIADRELYHRLFALDAYSLAMEYVKGRFSVEGDLVAAVRFYRSRPFSRFWRGLQTAVARFGIGRFETWHQSRGRAAKNIRFHYDQSNDFYKQFLDARMVYSCAYFEHLDQSLDDAQLRKLEYICRKLKLEAGETCLDVGCGWGGLITHAAAEKGAICTGCTLSEAQFRFAMDLVRARGLDAGVHIELKDYRNMRGPFDKIASVGMFEHVGQRRLKSYFAALSGLLRPGGLLLNHGITRPEGSRHNAETVFIRRKVFPGSELPRLSDVIGAAELAGLEVLDVENLRPHYALTLRAWVRRLQENMTQCLHCVESSVYRTWLLAFAGSAASFEDGELNLNQVLLYKPGSAASRPLTREYMYA